MKKDYQDKFKNLSQTEKILYEYKGDDEIVTSQDLAEALSHYPEAEIVKTGFPTMDRLLNGIEGGELVVVTGPSGHGKTTITTSITQNMVANGVQCLWFTLEVTPRQFLQKISIDGKVPLFFMPRENKIPDINWIFDKIVEGIVKYDVQVIFIDHLHNLYTQDSGNSSLSLDLGDVVSTIKQIAITYGVVIFLIAHSRDEKEGRTSEPMMRDIRDSGMIPRLADTVIGVWNIKTPTSKEDLKKNKMNADRVEGDNWVKIKIFKNRREGTLGNLYAIHENHRFTEVDINALSENSALLTEYGDLEF